MPARRHRRQPACRRVGRARARGFTMIELVVTIVIVGIIFAIGSILLNQAFNDYFETRDISSADWQPRIALERMTRELRAIRSATATDLAIANANQIQFIDINGNPACFYLSGTTLMRSSDGPGGTCGATGPEPLADDISALSFSYWDQTTAATTNVTAVYDVTVLLGVSQGNYSGSFRATVHPRRF